jgi:hypothetical protein
MTYGGGGIAAPALDDGERELHVLAALSSRGQYPLDQGLGGARPSLDPGSQQKNLRPRRKSKRSSPIGRPITN